MPECPYWPLPSMYRYWTPRATGELNESRIDAPNVKFVCWGTYPTTDSTW
jgi:hypothetical protein